MADDTSSVTRRTKPSPLGRGLGALLGDRRELPVEASDQAADDVTTPYRTIAVAQIRANPDQPRRQFDDAALDELAASIAARGLLQPVILRRHGDGYQLIAGERRWRAAQRAQVHEIPAIIRDLSDREVAAVALIENLQREDLNPVEEARAYQKLVEEEGLTQADLASMVDKSRSHVANLMRLLQLPDAVMSLLGDGSLSMGHARALIGNDQAETLAVRAVREGLSVRDVEKLARKVSKGDATPRKSRAARDPAMDADIAALQRDLEDFLGLKVRIEASAEGQAGTVTVSYRNLDQLDLVCQRLTGNGV